MRHPLNGALRITTKYMEPGTGSLGKHLGIDYGVPVGTPVFAPVSGVVRELKNTSGPGSGGRSIELAGDDGKWHRFLHLSEQMVSVGQRVTEGQQIARSGATGDVTGPHLHWDVRKANTAWNASLANYFDPEGLFNQPPAVSKTIPIRMNGAPAQHWNVRTSPDMGNNVRSDGYAVGGQHYDGEIVNDGWAKINFRSKPGYVGPKTFTKV